MKNIILLIFVISSIANAQSKFQYFKAKYKAECASEKITDNRGNGYDNLYGTRNMRPVLHGVAYRGGANNFFHKSGKRENRNPLPEDGLSNLCSEGFSTAVYLYATNFADSKKSFISKSGKDTLKYIQNSGMSRETMRKIMLMTLDVINNPETGPIYLHCWNGWHQSGYVSAALLMQFCDWTNEQAYEYWMKNTDGVNKGYENVKNLVRSFKPFEDIKIDKSVQQEICPCMK